MGWSLHFTPWGHECIKPPGPPKFGSEEPGRMLPPQKLNEMLHLKENGHYTYGLAKGRDEAILEMLHPQNLHGTGRSIHI